MQTHTLKRIIALLFIYFCFCVTRFSSLLNVYDFQFALRILKKFYNSWFMNIEDK